MFLDRSTLHTSIQGLVGAHQTVNPEYPTLLPSLLVSRSGRFWNDEHSLLKIENIDQCLTNYSHFNYTAFSAATRDAGGYVLGTKVSFTDDNDYEYVASTVSDSDTPDPGDDEDVWREIDELNDYLIQLDHKSTDMTLDSVMNHKKMKGEVKSLFSNVQLFTGQARTSDVVTNEGAMVGLRIRLADQRSLVTILHKLGHLFNDTVNDLTVYLYHSSQQAAITTFTVTHTTGKSSQWTSLDNYTLRWLSDNHDIGGSFMLVYFQDDIGSAKAIRKDIIWNEYAKCCDPKTQYEEYSQFTFVTGIKVPSTYLNGTSLPDVDFESDNFSDYFNNYGLNLQFSAKCDLTPFIIQQEELIAEVKSLNMAYLLLRDMAYNTRGSNALANQVKEQAKRELFSFKDAWGTVMDRLNKATKSLDFDLSGLDEACLPCNDGLMVSYGSV